MFNSWTISALDSLNLSVTLDTILTITSQSIRVPRCWHIHSLARQATLVQIYLRYTTRHRRLHWMLIWGMCITNHHNLSESQAMAEIEVRGVEVHKSKLRKHASDVIWMLAWDLYPISIRLLGRMGELMGLCMLRQLVTTCMFLLSDHLSLCRARLQLCRMQRWTPSSKARKPRTNW